MKIGLDEGAELLTGGHRNVLPGELAEGYYFEPTVFKGHNKMRIFQEEIFGPVLAVTTFKDEAEALEIANDTMYGLGAGVWSRDMNRAYPDGQGHQGRPRVDELLSPVSRGRPVRGYKASGVGRENHKMMLDHYTQTKNLFVSYDPKAQGFF